MERLVSTSEAAQLLGLSVQGIHYRIKQGQLKSIKENGKVFVYLNETTIKNNQQTTKTPHQEETQINQNDAIIEVKDEQIVLLKKTIKWIKTKYESEIKRLEKNQKKIIQVFQSEVNLLQSAFNEMRSLYALEHKNTNNSGHSSSFEIMSINDFFLLMKKHGKNEVEIKKMIFIALHNKDKRFYYDKELKEIIIYKSEFLDLI